MIRSLIFIYVDFNDDTMEQNSDGNSTDDITEQNSDSDGKSNDDNEYLTMYYHGSEC